MSGARAPHSTSGLRRKVPVAEQRSSTTASKVRACPAQVPTSATTTSAVEAGVGASRRPASAARRNGRPRSPRPLAAAAGCSRPARRRGRARSMPGPDVQQPARGSPPRRPAPTNGPRKVGPGGDVAAPARAHRTTGRGSASSGRAAGRRRLPRREVGRRFVGDRAAMALRLLLAAYRPRASARIASPAPAVGVGGFAGSRVRPRRTALIRPLNVCARSRGARSTEVSTAAWAGSPGRAPGSRPAAGWHGAVRRRLLLGAPAGLRRWVRDDAGCHHQGPAKRARSRAGRALSAGWLRPSSIPARPRGGGEQVESGGARRQAGGVGNGAVSVTGARAFWARRRKRLERGQAPLSGRGAARQSLTMPKAKIAIPSRARTSRRSRPSPPPCCPPTAGRRTEWR